MSRYQQRKRRFACRFTFVALRYVMIYYIQRTLEIHLMHSIFKETVLFRYCHELFVHDCQGSTLAVFRYPEHPRFSDGIPDSPAQ